VLIYLKKFMNEVIALKDIKEEFINRSLAKDMDEDIYSALAVLNLYLEKDTHHALNNIIRTAKWFELPHPNGRDPRGESDFVAIRLIPVLFLCPEKLSAEAAAAIKKFYLERDYSSMFGSENHALMFRVARYLAAQYYQDETFVQYGKTAEQAYKEDGAYIYEFIRFRARQGWGEFDSTCYGGEIVLILTTLFDYTDNADLKQLVRMMLDLILLDMVNDSLHGLYGGAHGRIYPGDALFNDRSSLFAYYTFFIGDKFADRCKSLPHPCALLTSYRPSPIVFAVLNKRTLPFENREVKHLHSMFSWIQENIQYDRLKAIDGKISKSTYVTEDYLLGAVNFEDAYPAGAEFYSDAEYAHHQQHEWDLTFTDTVNVRIFTQHPGDDENHTHNEWTGDRGCCCGTFYANHDTALAMYDIVNEKEVKYIHAFVPLAAFEQVVKQEKYLFLKHGKLYVSLYFDNGYTVTGEGDFANRELISNGTQNACVCRVEYCRNYEDMDEFIKHMTSLPVVFDREKLMVSFDGISMDKQGNSEHGIPNVYPYAKTYDCPNMQSEWNSGIIHCQAGDETETLDFINNKRYGTIRG